MRKLLFLVAFFLIGFKSIGQVDNADSLNYILDTISTIKAKVYFCMDQGDVYMNRDLDALKYWYDKGIKIGEGTEEEYLLVMLYGYLSYEYSARGDYETQAETIHKGKEYINKDTPFKYERTLKSAEAQYYIDVKQFESAIGVYDEIITRATLDQDSVILSSSLHNLGICYYRKGDMFHADSLINEAYIINKIIGQELYEINNLSMLANIQSQLENDKKSLEYNLIAKEKYDKRNEISGMTFIRSNLAENYWNLGQKKLAYKYADTCLIMAKEYELKEWEWNTYSRLSSFHEEDKNYKKALEYYILYSETKSNSINEQSTTKLESLTSELNEKKLLVFEQNETLQKEKIKLQDEKIKTQNSENENKKLLNYFLIAGIIIAFGIGGFIYNRLKLTNKQNQIIEDQKLKVQIAYEEIAVKNSDITASITYAKRIQNSILPTDELLESALKDYFILYKPKDLVSGDFYWMQKVNDLTLIAVADCTGHGVPGALVSVVCYNALNRSVKEFGLIEPGQILDKTREIVIEQFSKSNDSVKDGMDIALCSINNSTNEVKFAGANNPLWLIRNKELMITKGDKQPIGNHQDLEKFTTHTLSTKPDDKFYIFSDGYADQFGGDKGKKFKTKSLATLLTSISDTPINTQNQQLDFEFEKWKGDIEQLDDVCVIGFTI